MTRSHEEITLPDKRSGPVGCARRLPVVLAGGARPLRLRWRGQPCTDGHLCPPCGAHNHAVLSQRSDTMSLRKKKIQITSYRRRDVGSDRWSPGE
ncbi:hypothetical protein RRG08_017361 [Elysia crispata]|uniref:Uncharacterized protein n=1 Tax=Elysia crispata TaxID=231223 RepID=A0AAE1AMY7_9GAST|nr:hypothetical protein RRG08_017361 [Elysia crispata]